MNESMCTDKCIVNFPSTLSLYACTCILLYRANRDKPRIQIKAVNYENNKKHMHFIISCASRSVKVCIVQ